MDRHIRTVEDVLSLLDGLFAREADRWTTDGASWWDTFYADRTKPVPFFVAKPDENLVSYADRGLIAPGRALDLGCGPGRNALHLAALGFEVDAVDLSPAALAWAGERAREAGADVRFHCGDAFALTATELTGPYDLIYDSGCFHHLPPHRRISYLALLDRCLAPGGHLALTCFAAGEAGMGSELPDAAFYDRAGLQGGLRVHAGVIAPDLFRPDGGRTPPHAQRTAGVRALRRALPLDGAVPPGERSSTAPRMLVGSSAQYGVNACMDGGTPA